MDTIYIVLIAAACVLGLILLLRKKKPTATYTPPTVTSTPRPTTPPARPGAPASRPAAAPSGPVPKPATAAPRPPQVSYAQQPPVQRDPVITIFQDKTIRQVRRCPSCDGENPPHAQGCVICGRRM